jgi:hypothetical protein
MGGLTPRDRSPAEQLGAVVRWLAAGDGGDTLMKKFAGRIRAKNGHLVLRLFLLWLWLWRWLRMRLCLRLHRRLFCADRRPTAGARNLFPNF